MNTNNDVKWRRFIVPKKVEQINDHLFIDTYKSNNIKIGVNDMTVNDCEMKKTKLGQYRRYQTTDSINLQIIPVQAIGLWLLASDARPFLNVGL